MNKKGCEYLKEYTGTVWPQIWHLCAQSNTQVTKCLISKEMGQQWGPDLLLLSLLPGGLLRKSLPPFPILASQ